MSEMKVSKSLSRRALLMGVASSFALRSSPLFATEVVDYSLRDDVKAWVKSISQKNGFDENWLINNLS